MPLPSDIVDLDEFSESVNAVIYGEAGSGKTTLLAQLPDSLILATDKGTVSASLSKSRAKNVKVWPIRHWAKLEEAYLYLRGGNHPFKWVVIDSAPAMQHLLLRNILENDNRINPEKYDLDLPQMQHHQLWQNKFKRFVQDFNDLPVNVLWTSIAQELDNADGDPVRHTSLQGKEGFMSLWFEAEMDLVAYYASVLPKTEGSGDDDESKKAPEAVRRLIFENILPFKDKPGLFAKHRYPGHFPKFIDMSTGDKQLVTLAQVMARIENVSPKLGNDEDFSTERESTPAPVASGETVTSKAQASKFTASNDDDDDED